MTTTMTTPRAGRCIDQPHHDEKVRKRVAELLRTEIRFVPNDSFLHMDEETTRRMLADVEAADVDHVPPAPARGLPAHLARLCESQLLSAEMERELFFRKNYLKFRANALRSRLNPDRPDAEAVQQIERLLKAAQKVRDRILRANTRLAVSVVKKFVAPQYSFDELLSEGISSLMRAIDSFDYDRGFRFSTYAYRTISRHASRTVADHHRRTSRFVTGSDESVFEESSADTHSEAKEMAQSRLHTQLYRLIDRLDRRDRLVLRCRYALGRHRKVKTCQYLADKLGLSKERVRQLEHRAIAKLRALASEHQLCDLAEAAIG